MTKLEEEMLNYYKYSLALYEEKLRELKTNRNDRRRHLVSAEHDLVRKKIKEFQFKIVELAGTLEGS